MNTLNHSVVVFSRNYLPLNQINIKRAIALLVMGKAEPIDFFGDLVMEVRSPSILISVPRCIRLHVSPERMWKMPPVSRKNLLRRDAHQCQYCGNRKNLTIDHIIPRSKGGKHTWNNVVIACVDCNSRKGNKTPTEAGMALATQPKAPMHPAVAFAEHFWQQQNLNLNQEQ